MSEFSIIELEDHFVIRPDEFTIYRPGLYPSEASVEYTKPDGRKVVVGKCLRQVWYRCTNAPSIGLKTGLMMKAHLGKSAEMATIERWKQLGVWLGNAVKFYNQEYVLSGELDCIIKEPNTLRKICYEIKSFYGYNANKEICGAKRDMIPGRPKESQFLQAAVYKWEYKNIIDEQRLYYVERGDGHRLEFEVGFDTNEDGTHQLWWRQVPGKYWNWFRDEKVLRQYTIEDVYARFKKAIGYIKSKTLPPKDYERYITDETLIEAMYEDGDLGKTKYMAWKKDPKKNPIESWQCGYCDNYQTCLNDELKAGLED